ncbi:alpha/beta hydrolase [Pseudobacter ginsenosidimutans]|nr:alpha/beta hydrolase-fold protein [Pseudobacter ginsenosidimutans]
MKTLGLSLILLSAFIGTNAQNRIMVSLQNDLKGPYTGRLFVYTLKDTSKHFSMNFAEDEAAFSAEVFNWKNGQTIELPQYAIALNQRLPQLSSGYYKLIAILDTNTRDRGIAAPGNLFTRQEAILKVSEGKENTVELMLSHVFPAKTFPENDSIREVNFISDLLSRFKGYPVTIKAAVILPPGYEREANNTYPVVYVIPGWGGTHYQALSAGARKIYGVGTGKNKIYVFLNPELQNAYGPHAFVDSRVNGPCGKALVEELMPYIQKTFRASPDPRLNFLTGQSTGGYGAVWLALGYPEKFGGAWVTAPDPLDFSSFTGVDIYNDENYYTDSKGRERGINKVNGVFTSTLRKTFALEIFEANGGQQQAFDAEFGPADINGRPLKLFDEITGKINKTVANSWRLYDMAFYAESYAETLKKIKFPVRIYVGSNDNFLLNESALSFARKIKHLNLPIYVEEIPGADHFQVRNVSVTRNIQTEIDQLISMVKE